MGFRPEPKQYKLTFSDIPELDGLEVVMGSVSVGEFNELMRLALPKAVSEETLEANDKTLELFASKIVSWNLDGANGKPLKPTVENIRAQERSLIGSIITGWQVALVTVPKRSETPSGDGEISPEDLEALAASSSPSI